MKPWGVGVAQGREDRAFGVSLDASSSNRIPVASLCGSNSP